MIVALLTLVDTPNVKPFASWNIKRLALTLVAVLLTLRAVR